MIHYTIVWLSYDRFLAVWFYHYYYRTQQSLVKRLRIIFTCLFCTAMNLRHLFTMNVECFNDKAMVKVANDTKCDEQGSWYIEDVVQEKGPGMVWEDGMIAARIVLLVILPAVLVLVFNSGIVVGLVRHRLQNMAVTRHTREHLIHIFFLAFNQIFREEMNILFNATKRSLNNTLGRMTQTSGSSFCTRSRSTMHNTHIKKILSFLIPRCH
ncbi:hypothetical protein E2C01_072560 [Portunus trituberculatus]|uniref:G-protein coupled receptors family 1 profile domain-containing protein n=1 Tax=Portunus trituberculatus TaxID=210409 RepID=A0A5B7I7I5_PORTR|nr:hypothetical protein [Portunus trituberculatus]